MSRQIAGKALFWTILAVFVALIVWWCLYLPYDRARLYRAIPHETVFVSEHERLAGRWDEFVANPLTGLLMTAAGVDAAGAKALATDPGVRALIDRLAARDTLIAYAPALGAEGEAAWLISSWVGARGQLLRWGSRWGLLSGTGMRRTRLEGGRTVWVLDAGDAAQLSLTIMDGLLLGCYSRDPGAIRVPADRVESGAPIRTILRERLTAPDDGCLDRGWFAVQVQQGGARVPYAFRYTLAAHDSGGTEGRLVGRLGRFNAPAGGAPAFNAAEAAGLAGADPGLIVTAPLGYLRSVLATPGLAPMAGAVAETLAALAADDAPAFAGLFGDDLSGRILGLRVPTLITGVRVDDENAVGAAMQKTVDKLNARHGWSLLPRQAVSGGVGVTVLDTGRGGLYASMASGERVAYAVKDGWLLIGSNADALARLLSANPAGGRSAWAAASRMHETPVFAWTDIESAGRAARNAIAVYSLALIAQGTAGADDTRRQMETARDWIAAAAPLRTGALWLGADGADVDLRFRFGTPHRAATQ